MTAEDNVAQVFRYWELEFELQELYRGRFVIGSDPATQESVLLIEQSAIEWTLRSRTPEPA